jgi:1-acyl-sn-glycerol-3-phosphate acyltransferase
VKETKKEKKAYVNKSKDTFLQKLSYLVFIPLRVVIFFVLFQLIFRVLFRFFHRVRFDKNGCKLPKKPFIVLCNHTNNWDGLYLVTYLKRFIYFIVHDEFYKNRLRKTIAYNLLGQIGRGKIKNDIFPIRKFLDLKQKKQCVGVFPEGDISYTGRSLPVGKSIAKLVKLLDIPVVAVRIDGGSFHEPRHSYGARRVKISMKITDVIAREDVNALSRDELYDRIYNAIRYDDGKYQAEHRNVIRGKNMAEKLENVLFMCPDCGKTNTLRSSGDKLFCGGCGYTVRQNEYNRFELVKGKRLFQNIGEWDDYQRENIRAVIRERAADGGCLIRQSDYNYYKVPDGNFFSRPLCRGEVWLTAEALRFESGGVSLSIPVLEIERLYIQYRGSVEFTYGDSRYRFDSAVKEHYGYRYQVMIETIQKMAKGE